MPLIRIVLRLLATLAIATALGAPLTGPGGPLQLSPVAQTEPALSIRGTVTGLVPGRAATLVLTLVNPGDTRVTVQSLAVQVAAASPRCAGTVIDVSPWRGRIEVPARASRQASLPVRLASAAAGCAGASWPLTFAAG